MMMKIMKEEKQETQQPQQGGFTSQIQQIVQAQEMLEQINGGDDDMQELVNALSQELNQIKQQVAQGNEPRMGGDDPMTAAIANLAAQGDVDPETITGLAQGLGVDTDPEVRKKEIEMETEMQKMNQKQEMVNNMMEGFQKAMENVSGLSQLAAAASGGSAQEERREEPAEERRREPIDDPDTVQSEPEEDDFNLSDLTSEEEEDHSTPIDNEPPGGQTDFAVVDEEQNGMDEESRDTSFGQEDEQDTLDGFEEPTQLSPEEVVHEHGITSKDYNRFKSLMSQEGYTVDEANDAWNRLRDEGVIVSPSSSNDTEAVETDGGNPGTEGDN